jgi:hypothetical protein
MAQRRFHYEQAFEHYLRANRAPYVAVDEARKSLLPTAAAASLKGDDCVAAPAAPGAIKSFDFVVYAEDRNLLVDVKGRMFGSANARLMESNRRFESWVTNEDVDGLTEWERLFGAAFTAVFVFLYCLRQQPPDALFEEVFEFAGKFYAMREIELARYRELMVVRSKRWGTVHLPGEAFQEHSRPFTVRPGTRRPIEVPRLSEPDVSASQRSL